MKLNKWMRFNEWMILAEIGEEQIESKQGHDLFEDPAMEIAMYMLYRQAYDPISVADREEEINHHMTKHGVDRASAEKMSTSPSTAWSYRDWNYSGNRAPSWKFCGTFPSESDLEIIRNHIKSYDNYGKYGNKMQEIADELLELDSPSLSKCGGLSYRYGRHGMVKLTGMWGKNSIAKMRGAAEVIHLANQ